MSKQRYLDTKFWDDNYIVNKDPIEKLLFIYLLTNPLTNICGIYEISLRRIAFDTGIDKEMVNKIIERFEKDDKIKYEQGYIALKNFTKYQKDNPKINKGIETLIREVPVELVKWVNIDYNRLSIDYDSLLKAMNNINYNINYNINDNINNNINDNINNNINDNINNNDKPPTTPLTSKQIKEKENINAELKNSMDYKTTCYLVDKILTNNPRARVPNKDPTNSLMRKWVDEIEKLNRLGPVGANESEHKGYSWKEIKEIIDWCQDDNFWRINILSTAKLRVQIVTLENNMKISKPKLSMEESLKEMEKNG